MKKGIKIALITALILLGIGIILTAVAFCMVGFELSGLNGVESVTLEHSIGSDFSNIDISAVEADVNIQKSNTGKAYVVCRETDKITHSVHVENGTLSIIRYDQRSWWECVGIFWAEMSVTLYLPEAEYGNVRLESVSGNVRLDNGFQLGDLHMKTSSGKALLNTVHAGRIQISTISGDVEAKHIICKDLSLDTASGDLLLSKIETEEVVFLKSTSGNIEWDHGTGSALQISAVSGNLSVSDCLFGGDLSANTTSGEIRMQGIDAQNLTFSTVSGNINISLLKEKRYETSTVSGNIHVPNDGGEGNCKLSSVSGNIRVTVGE